MQLPILSLLIVFPLLGTLLLIFLPRKEHRLLKLTTLGISLVEFALSLPLWFRFDSASGAMQFTERYNWLPQYGISYILGMDGFSLLLVLLTTFLTPLCVLATWEDIQTRVKEFMICILALMSGMIGVFVALDLFLFYVFWEVMLIPMYFIIGIWGGPRRIYAAVKFFIYTMSGSVLMLVAILVLYFMYHEATGTFSFHILDYHQLGLPAHIQMWLFLAFAVAFAIKVPMFPFHTWLPDAHVEAPTAGSVILAGVLLKMGTYGFLRFCLPIFPQATLFFVPLILALALIGIIYGALVSLAQDDVKKLVAYSSVSHLGYCMLGMFALNVDGIKGSLIQMINHGLSTGALFLIVGILYERRHTRLISEYGGIMKVMPIFAFIFLLVAFSSMGVPGTNGFVGELLILIGAFQASLKFGLSATVGLILGAVYLLWTVKRVTYGPITKEENRTLKDMTVREYAYMLPVMLFIFWIGLYPKPFLRTMDASVTHLLESVQTQRTAQTPYEKPMWVQHLFAKVDLEQQTKGQGR